MLLDTPMDRLITHRRHKAQASRDPEESALRIPSLLAVRLITETVEGKPASRFFTKPAIAEHAVYRHVSYARATV